MQKHQLCVHVQPYHYNATDRDWIAELNPSIVKVVSNGPKPPIVEDIPDGATYLYRDYAVEHNYRHIFASDPEEYARLHAEASIEASANMVARGLPVERQMFETMNEPAVWGAESLDKLVRYIIKYLELVRPYGFRVAVVCLSVGWPDNNGPDTPPNWGWFEPIYQAMRKIDVLAVHEYWADAGCRENWGWWGGRILSCPYPVEFIITEAGVDSGVKYSGTHDGWIIHYKAQSMIQAAERYTDELWDYMGLMAQDPRVQGIFPYTYDYATGSDGHGEWWSFDQRLEDLKKAMRVKWNAEGIPPVQDYDPGTIDPPPIDPPPSGVVDMVGKTKKHETKVYDLRDEEDIEITVLHYTWVTPPEPTLKAEMEQVRSIARGHVRRGWAGIGYHYLVGPSGTIYKVNSLNRVAAHAGKYNPQSIGIACMLRQGEPTIAQVNATAELIKVLDYDLKLHYDLINTGCPGSYLGPAVWKALDITPPPIEPPPNFTVEHTPAEGYGVKIIIGNYHTPGAEVQLRWEWGQLETVIAGSKDEYGPGGFEIYAGDDHSVHQIIVEGVQYEIPMVPGKSTLCRWN
jgi:hypothetical protein